MIKSESKTSRTFRTRRTGRTNTDEHERTRTDTDVGRRRDPPTPSSFGAASLPLHDFASRLVAARQRYALRGGIFASLRLRAVLF